MRSGRVPAGDAGTRQDSAGSAGGDTDPVVAARAICLRLLTDAPRTRFQLAEALRKRNVPAGAAEVTLDRFAEVGLIDDAAFAREWVVSRQRGRGLAPRALAEELRRRGVGRGEVEAALAEVEPDDVRAAARRLVSRRLASTAGLPQATRARRLAGMLARKGYPGEVASKVIREALSGQARHDVFEVGEDHPPRNHDGSSASD